MSLVSTSISLRYSFLLTKMKGVKRNYITFICQSSFSLFFSFSFLLLLRLFFSPLFLIFYSLTYASNSSYSKLLLLLLLLPLLLLLLLLITSSLLSHYSHTFRWSFWCLFCAQQYSVFPSRFFLSLVSSSFLVLFLLFSFLPDCTCHV